MILSNKMDASCSFLKKNGVDKLRFGVILGTGFGTFINSMEDAIVIPYDSIPHFPEVTVEGHAGNLVYGSLHAIPILVMQGRFHRYEGYTNDQIGYPIHVMKALGVDILIITNAAGGLNPAFKVGDLMIVEDHIHLMGGAYNTLGDQIREGPCYDDELKEHLFKISIQKKRPVQRGILSWMPGPSFETRAEINLLRKLGADAVTMSTIPEAIIAHSLEMRILGISCISNQCAGVEEGLINTAEVMMAVRSSAETFSRLIFHLLDDLQ